MFLLGESDLHSVAAVECFHGYLGLLSEMPKLSLDAPEHREKVFGTVAFIFFLNSHHIF